MSLVPTSVWAIVHMAKTLHGKMNETTYFVAYKKRRKKKKTHGYTLNRRMIMTCGTKNDSR